MNDYFFRDKEIINFDGNYKADETELFVINNFPLNNEILDTGNNGINYENLNIDDFSGKTKVYYTDIG